MLEDAKMMNENEMGPRIVLSTVDVDRLADLALAASVSVPAVADALMEEANRADVVAPHRLPRDAVAMYSTVEFRDEATGRVRKVQIVYPHDADIGRDKVSVLTPVGVALIGLSAGQSMMWQSRDGLTRRLTVLHVRQAPATIDVAETAA